MLDIQIKNTIDMSKLMEIANKGTTILVGYPYGKVQHGKIDAAHLAEILIKGKKGAKKKGWNFIADGLNKSDMFLRTKIKEHYVALIRNQEGHEDNIGNFCVETVQNFVRSLWYAAEQPNEQRYLTRKIHEHGEIRPVIAKGTLIDNLSYVVRKEG